MTDTIKVLHGDCLAILPTLDADSLDCCICDPPYHLTAGKRGGSGDASVNPNSPAGRSMISTGFMGKAWDGGNIAFKVDTWAEVYRVLKPGAYLLAFGGTRTFHRMACAIEDAGFEIRDTLCWLYGSGFPKSHNLSKAIDKAAGAEREIIAEGEPVKRMIPGADQNKDGWIKDNGREFVPTQTAPATDAARQWAGWGSALKPAMELVCMARKPLSERTIAANVLRHGTGAINVDACRVGDEPLSQHGRSGSENLAMAGRNYAEPAGRSWTGRWPANVCHDGSAEVMEGLPQTISGSGSIKKDSATGYQGNAYGAESRPAGTPMISHSDLTGSASRFFYTSKADASDRLQSKHPTVKPVDLMRWLARMVTPPGGTILDPFAGSGTTGMAAMAEGFNAILIERETEYVADIKRRIAHVSGADAPLFAQQEDGGTCRARP